MTQSKILIIEDESSVLENTVEMLILEGFEVRGAKNGQIGVNYAKEFKPDLILCDISMPVMDGYEVLDVLRNWPQTALTPFVFLTARTEREDIRHGMNLGADDYLTKPFSVSELLETVYARLERKDVIRDVVEEKMDELRDSIILSMPHELRTPLTSILGFSDILIEDAKGLDGDSVVKMARHINKAGVRLSRLVENYLIYSQIEIFRLDPKRVKNFLDPKQCNVRENIEKEAMARATQYQRQDDLSLSIQEANVKVAVEYLKKITEELVDNAFKFSDRGHRVQVVGKVESPFYVFSVSDSGRGMTAEQISEIGAYRQFERDVYEQQGSGLGLIITKRLAELHKGLFEMRSDPGNLTTASVRLLLAEPDSATAELEPGEVATQS